MTGRPWLASTTSGALVPETASLSVVLRSSKDLATRLILTLGYLAWNWRLSSFICAFWPPRTSWSQTVGDVAGLGDVDLLGRGGGGGRLVVVVAAGGAARR